LVIILVLIESIDSIVMMEVRSASMSTKIFVYFIISPPSQQTVLPLTSYPLPLVLMTPIIRIAIESDFDGILDLQSPNLYSQLAPADLAGGFVTTPFTPDLLRQLLRQKGVFVAEEEGKIGGYLLAGDWGFFSQWEIFRVMMARLPHLKFAGAELSVDRSFQYGPICLDRAIRGSNILPQLFDLMRSSFTPKFPVGVNFINQLNQRSFAAHTRKLNLEIIDEFELNGNLFYTLAFLTRL
jgi:hypothetical protein